MNTQSSYFDTHNFVKRLIEAGFSEEQAETLVKEHKEIMDNHLASKSDIDILRKDLTIAMFKMGTAIISVLVAFISFVEFYK